jgi:cell division protein FtsZ
MTINLRMPDVRELRPRITVFGVGGAGGNAVNNMITAGLQGVDFVCANTDAQALSLSKCERIIQMGVQVTEGLGAGSQPDVGRAAAEEVIDEIRDHLQGAHMVFVTAGMGGGTGTGAAPVIAAAVKEQGILTVGVVTKPFHFEGVRRMRMAEAGITELQKAVDTLLIIPNQNLFRVANEKTTFADAFAMADQVLYSGVACITDLMVKEGLINLDFADVRAVMREMGKAMMGTGEASGEKRALRSAEAAISNPLIDDVSMKGARGLLVSITGGRDLTLYEVDEAATRIREEVDQDANIIVGATFDESLEGIIRVSVVATGIDLAIAPPVAETRMAEMAQKMRPAPRQLERVIKPEPSAAVERAIAPTAQARHASVEEAGEQAHAEEVTIRPLTLKPAPAADPEEEHSESEAASSFVPPEPERVHSRAPRMPRVEELPVPAQNEIRAHSTGSVAADDSTPQKQRLSLLQRLAAVGLGRKEDGAESVPSRPPARPALRSSERAPAPAPRQPEVQRVPDSVAEYGRRPAQPRVAHQALDTHGRVTATSIEDDELEIPAFLRRQAH